MLRCPKCHKFGVEHIGNGFWKCLWRNCSYLTANYNEIINAKHPIRFYKFIKSIKKKTSIG